MKTKFPHIDLSDLPTPCFVIDEATLENNGKILHSLEEKANCKILLALKAYACGSTFPLLSQYLSGVCSGSRYEAILGKRFGKEVHSYCPAFRKEDFDDILKRSDHIIFNSFSQFDVFREEVIKYNSAFGKNISMGLRVNPEESVAPFAAYDPCARFSRLGIRADDFYYAVKERKIDLKDIDGLHFHALCEQGADELEIVLNAFEKKFGDYLGNIKWVNFGGGHHITNQGYNLKKLVDMIHDFRQRYSNIKDIYLEPGEAVALNAVILVASVLDIIRNESKRIAIIDSSVETHFPDVMITRCEKEPYMQQILGAKPIRKGEKPAYDEDYIIAGMSCAAGDVFGEYSFRSPLRIGDKIIFTDCAHYTMVKTSSFCGVPLPTIFLLEKDGELTSLKTFYYDDYRERLG